jgi:hypothetical protein
MAAQSARSRRLRPAEFDRARGRLADSAGLTRQILPVSAPKRRKTKPCRLR